ncbi:hypothetical protein KUTeg_015709 [Tegillarca granosa]|uniref:Uncharacterized protein n=1 Tax=Tegillarca granosa TaxID=220873 RepID=A0ABQ9EN50_TEGGR|nr:hypothetical protein KUTeg_015709 [Tegillarca granosa]
MEMNKAEATGPRMLRPRKQTGGQKETRKSSQPTSRKSKDHKRRRPQTVGRKRQKVSVTTLPSSSSSVHQVTQNNMAAPINSRKYGTIRWAASKIPDPDWRQYDEQFRLRWAKILSKSWARLDFDLSLLFISASTPFYNPSQKFNLGTMELACKPKVPLDHIVQYIAYLSLKSLSCQTGKTRIATLSFFNKISNSIDHTKIFWSINFLKDFEGLDTRAPITLPILTQLPRALVCICFSSYEAKLFHAAFTLAFFGFLRVGEIALSYCKSNSSTVLRISDISIQTSMLKLKFDTQKMINLEKPLLFILTLSRHQLLVQSMQ